MFMTKKAGKRPTSAKESAKRIKAKVHARKSGKGPSIPDLTDALAAAMASLKAAQISRLLGAAVPGGLPDEADGCQAAAGKKKARKKKAGKARKQAEKKARGAKKRAMKEARQASPAGEGDPQVHDSGTRLPAAA